MKKTTTQKTKKQSVRTKLISIMLLVSIVPLLVAVAISYNSSTNSAKETAKQNLDWQAKYIESEVDKMLIKAETSLGSFASSPETIAFLKGELEDTTVVKQQMVQINESFHDSNTIVMSNSNGDMVLRSDDGDLKNIGERDYFQAAIKGETYVSNVFVSSVTNSRNICVAVPIFDTNGTTVLGVVHKTLNPDDIHTLLAEDAEEAFVVDKNADMVAHSDFEIAATDEAQNFSSSPYMSSEDATGFYISTAKGYPVYVSYVRNASSGYVICAAKAQKDIVAEARQGAMLIILTGIAMVIAVLVLSIIIANNFTKPMLEVNKVLSALANGEFKKTDKFTKRADEFGQMINNANSLIDKLSTIVGHIKDSTNTVGESSDELSEMANQIAATTESVAVAVQQIASGAVEQAEEIQSAADSTNQITTAVDNVQSSTNDMSNLADRMKSASEASSNSLATLQATSSEMTSKIEEISSKISSTQNAVANINERVEGISGIAAQTNLLSLNASIEAARAGEAGKGFAVVAEEIRKLADDSENLAQEIRILMDQLLAEAEQAVTAAALVMNGNEEQQKALGETLFAVEGMLQDIEETVSSVSKISGEATNCVNSNTVVANAMSSLSAISEENAASSETTGASVEELSATVTNLAESATNLRDIAEQLNEEMKFFK
ncbi:methyl-accepting chemotaxis protein [Pseudobutyrivibrio ruminis]|uniref:Methyl-accepting chemotaxis protein n=1 Tax=Pseudobutyrivibrio ruminis DSM 9787 TaxID=1123011 RepID=A0A285SXI6_9FIRM|nr:methyl-accepting chemotaxis protein [Pseudobutyrivibrio ruminis]SOC12988.1 methyl-accepting chemotaxis protein [Pseudobutyrivibrio ruminis DSM 9787]